MHKFCLNCTLVHVQYLSVGGLGFRLGSSGFNTVGWELLVGEGGVLSDLYLVAPSRISCSSFVPKSRNSAN